MPDWSNEVRRRLAPLALGAEREAEIVEELSQHLAAQYDELRAQGASHEAAWERTLAEMDAGGALAPALRAVERRTDPEPVAPGALWSRARGRLAQDLRYAVRRLRQRPGFTAVAVLTLALGIGANTAIFGVVSAVLLRPLPFPEPDRVVAFWGTAPEKGLERVPTPDGLIAWYDARQHTMEHVAAYGEQGFTLTGKGDPERVDGARVSAGFFRVLGVQPAVGRAFVDRELVVDSAVAVVISHAMWQRRFGGDRSVIGQTIDLDDHPTTIVGVMPPGFDFPRGTHVWVPLVPDPDGFSCWCYRSIGRLEKGRTPEDARRDLATITDDLALARPDVFPNARRGGSRVVVKPLAEHLVGDVKAPLLVVFGAGGFVLLIACANIANLLLARAAEREREMAVRCCVGASPRRIASQLITESLVLAFAGAAVGVLLAWWAVRLLRRLPLDQVPRLDTVGLDPATLVFSVAVAAATGLLFGLAPALRASRLQLQHALKEGVRGTAGVGRARLSSAFVVSQFALSLVLLIGVGLVLRSFQRLLAVNPGFRTDNVLLARVELPYPRYASDTAVRAFYAQLLERARQIPGVSAAGFAQQVPLAPGNWQDNVVAEGQPPRPGEPVRVANIRYVTPDYFAAIGTPILRGRGILPSDHERSPRVVVVDESLARHFWPREDALGKRIRHGGDDAPWLTIVGIVPNVKHSSLEEAPTLQLYEAFEQRATWGGFLVVRSTVEPQTLTPVLRTHLAALDPTLPLFDVHTFEDSFARSLSPRRLTSRLLTAFGAVALLLAAIGIYGVISLSVNGRFKEFGVRLALGARPLEVLGMVLRQGALLAAGGAAVGLLAALWLTRFLRSLLFGVEPIDVPTYLAVTVVLTLVALAATLGPAWRATKSDPVRALKAE